MRRSRRLTSSCRLLGLALCVIGGAGIAEAADGDIDLSFGTRGLLATGLAAPGPSSIAARQQVDGRVLAAVADGIVRFEDDGTLDATFGTAGVAAQPLSLVLGIALAPNGDIVIHGQKGFEPAFARLDSAGQLDPAFGTAGVAIVPGFISQIPAATVQGDGKVVGIVPASGTMRIVRLDTDGSLDATFGTGGLSETPLLTNYSAEHVFVESGGGILVGGSFFVARLLSDGTLDASWGTGGFVYPTRAVHGFGVQSGGKVLVAITANVLRLLPDGSLDPTFGDAGIVQTRSGGGLLRVLGDDRFLVAGADASFERYGADGVVDADISLCGMAMAAVPGYLDGTETAIAVDASDRVLFLVRHRTPDAPAGELAILRFGTAAAIPTCQPASPGGATVRLKGSAYGYAAKLVWKSSQAVTKLDLGDPLTSTDYLACVLASDTGTPRPLAVRPHAVDQYCARGVSGGFHLFGKPCWKETAQGFKHALGLKLSSGEPTKARIKLKMNTGAYELPPFDEPLIVRVRRVDAPTCWEATFSAPTVNDERKYKARSD